MTTRELLYIKTIADEGSMTRAAQKLFVTQPSLSHCVMNIEQQLGTRLFTRTSGGLVLTYAGEKYYRMACEVLRVYAAFESEISEERALAQGRVTVGITNYLATTHLPRMLPAFHREHPGIEVRICEETTDQVERSLLSGRLDFAILHTGPDDGVTGNPALEFESLTRDPFLIAAPPDTHLSALAKQKEGAPYPELDPALLGDEPFLMVSPGQRIRQITDRVLAEAGVKPNIVLTSRNYELLRRLTGEGMLYAAAQPLHRSAWRRKLSPRLLHDSTQIPRMVGIKRCAAAGSVSFPRGAGVFREFQGASGRRLAVRTDGALPQTPPRT